MTKVTIEYIDNEVETIKCNYSKTREGFLEIALTDQPPHERRFIPAHRIKNIFTIDIEEKRTR